MFKEMIKERIDVLQNLRDEDYKIIDEIVDCMVDATLNGHTIFSAGNGGSAANAQHITGDIVGRYKIERKAFSGISLTVEPSVITAIGNDYSYDIVFARQLDGLGRRGDVLIVMSSSANSPNLIKAVEKAKEKGIKTIGLLGNNGGKLKDMVDMSLCISSKKSDIVEEFDMSIAHMVLLDWEKRVVESEEDAK